MQQTVEARLECTVSQPTQLLLSIAAAHPARVTRESLTVRRDGEPVELGEIDDLHGTRLHATPRLAAGLVSIDYAATIVAAAEPTVATVPAIDAVRYLRPSRYCESDRLSPFARAEFAGVNGAELVQSVADWVYRSVVYLPGSSRPIDGAVATLLGRTGVCRDFAHLVIAMLRACDVPARLVSVYAPGLSPMDFHAVAEALVDGRWEAVDATRLAPRSTMVRIATGRDAADTAFLSSAGGAIDLTSIDVTAYTDRDLPADAHDAPASLPG